MGLWTLWKPGGDGDDGRCRNLTEEVSIVFWYDHDMGWWGYAGMGIGMMLFWGLIVAGIVALVIFLSRDKQIQRQPPPPDQILAARFAQGQISETEYRDRLAVLHERARD